ncbi:Formate/nitrite transporter FocA, FNT family [Tessaracoccus bendigoensis DSM 12906]|uniref:Formate/nitrite transporter FocA, FNT family n=1 Tax=Tessaracoccus bendigoensis DSM 12906 TaxID=1123357 RepID=A0A1M6NL20_9ACTN|nr:Formate/nitrite transporter FocA, FNT family [Tessaracoccus bendigoensis DSM 12906]
MVNDHQSHLYPGRVFIEAALEAADIKAHMSKQIRLRYLQRAAMAGVLIGIFYCAYFALSASFAAIPIGGTDLGVVGRLLGAFVFGWALVFIYFTKSELLTSNMMLSSIAVYHRRLTAGRALGLLGLCYLGNFLGGLMLAIPLRFSTLIGGETGHKMVAAVETKLGYLESFSGAGDLFVRAILCNLLINVAMLMVYNGYLTDVFTMALAMVLSVFLFVFLGLEHSVANTVLFTLVGLTHGIELLPAVGNIAIALVGNFVGGGLLIGVYYAFLNDRRSNI